MATTDKKTIEQRIAAEEAKIKKAQEALAKLKEKAANLAIDSDGVTQLIAAVDNIIKLHSVATYDVVKAIVKIKRAGLKIEKITRSSSTGAKRGRKAKVEVQ